MAAEELAADKLEQEQNELSLKLFAAEVRILFACDDSNNYVPLLFFGCQTRVQTKKVVS